VVGWEIDDTHLDSSVVFTPWVTSGAVATVVDDADPAAVVVEVDSVVAVAAFPLCVEPAVDFWSMSVQSVVDQGSVLRGGSLPTDVFVGSGEVEMFRV
jgi:hypothetical protein